MYPERLSTRVFLSFSLVQLLMLLLLGGFVWTSYESGLEAAAQKLLVDQAEAIWKDPEARLPQTETLFAVWGRERLPERIRTHLSLFEPEDYDAPVREWNEIHLWTRKARDGRELFVVLEVGETADRHIFGPNARRALVGGLTLAAVGLTSLGLLISRRLTRPLQTLTAEMDALTPGDLPPPMSIRYPAGEAGQLARAFDRLSLRIREAREREKRFTRNASHEFRTPLTLMRGATAVLRRSINDPTDKQARALNHLEHGIRDMTTSLEGFLLLARACHPVTAGAAEQPADILRECLALFPEADLHLSIAGEPPLQTHPDFFRITASNLIRNAVQHGRKSPVRVELTRDQLRVDNLNGTIPPPVLDQLGKPFCKGEESGGMGLGLSVSLEIAEHCGWSIRWEPLPPDGTRALLDFSHSSEPNRPGP